MGGGVLIFNPEGHLLIVKPTYRNTWSWPGGGSEIGESPYSAALRETKEELGVILENLKPAFVNYIPPRPDGTKDAIHFVFSANVEDGFLNKTVLPPKEIEDARFIDIASTGDYMKPYRVRAITTYIAHKNSHGLLYLEDGELING